MKTHLTLIILLICTFVFAGTPTSYVVFDYSQTTNTLKASLSLLRWNRINLARPKPIEAYDRILHFGKWINDPSDHLCQDTRAKVLIDESLVEVSFRGKKNCIVNEGEWYDPYTDETYFLASELQVDHMVPLKNAYISGADKWTFEKRCSYANFLQAPYHLIAVEANENMLKSDNSPNSYMPPNEEFHCEYLKNWLKVKFVWELNMSEAESKYIIRQINSGKCQASEFTISKTEFKKLKKAIAKSSETCH